MPPRRRSRIGCFGVLLFLIAAFGAVWALDAFFSAPWAYDIGGRPTLTGTWAGSFSSPVPGAERGRLVLDLHRGRRRIRRGWFGSYVKMNYFDHSLGGASVYGTGAWCKADGSVITYTLGGVVDRKAQKIALSLTSDSTVRAAGPQFRELRGSWDGASVVALQSEMRVYVAKPGGRMAYGPAPKEFEVAMRKVEGDSVRGMCVAK